MAFKVLTVDHVGVAVKDLAKIKQQMKDIFGLEPSLPDETVEEQHVIEKANNGKNGFQHVALRVDDIEAALADLQAKEVPLIDKKFRVGAGGCHIAFLHPKATGLLLELTERPGGPSFKK